MHYCVAWRDYYLPDIKLLGWYLVESTCRCSETFCSCHAALMGTQCQQHSCQRRQTLSHWHIDTVTLAVQHHRLGKLHAIQDDTVSPATVQWWLSRLYPSRTAKACTQFSKTIGVQGWVDLGGGYIAREFTRQRTVTYLRNNYAV